MAEQQNLDTACVLFWTPMPHCSDVYFHEQERLPEIYHAAGVVCSRVCETICSWGIILFLYICCPAVFASFPELCCLKTGSIVWYFVIPQRTCFVTCGASEHAFDMNNKNKNKNEEDVDCGYPWLTELFLFCWFMCPYTCTHTHTHTHTELYIIACPWKHSVYSPFFFSQRCCLLFHSWKKKKFHLILESIDEM